MKTADRFSTGPGTRARLWGKDEHPRLDVKIVEGNPKLSI
jgi:hypothetical protein